MTDVSRCVAIALTHGAGGNCDSPLLVALAEAFGATGIHVVRYDLPFRQRRPHGPPSPAQAERDRDGIRQAIATLRERCGPDGRVYAGGHSYGGRQTTMVASESPGTCDGLLVLSYPLHPPAPRLAPLAPGNPRGGHPTAPRTAHFPALRTDALFVSGTRDVFGSIDDLQAALRHVPARTDLLAVSGATHALLTRANANTLAADIVSRFCEFFSIRGQG